MYFLIEYDRTKAKTVACGEYTDLAIAGDARLARELVLHETKFAHELIILDAPTREHLRATHNRYMASVQG